MESFFDNQFQFLKHFDVKAQGKPQRKKKWLLSRQYLQPLNEPDDEDSGRDDQDDSPTGYKKKLRCAYEAAKYGMKEGVLTGVFLGGCWGIFKHLGENFTFNFRDSSNVGDKNKKKRNSAAIPVQESPVMMSRRSSQKDPSLGSFPSTERGRGFTPRGSEVYQENISNYKKSLSVVKEKSNEKNYYSTTSKNKLVYQLTNSKLPIRSEKQYPSLHSGGAGVQETHRYNFRTSREKVQIVGYAFIKTTGSITGATSGSGSIKSDGSDSPKDTGSIGKGEARNISSEDQSRLTEAGSSSIRRKKDSESASLFGSEQKKSSHSVKSVNQSAKSLSSPEKSSRQSTRSTAGSDSEKLTKSNKSSSGSMVVSSGELVLSQTERSRSILPDVVEETQNVTPPNTDCSGSINTTEDFQQQIIDFAHEVGIDKRESKISGISSITYSNSHQEVTHRVNKSDTPSAVGNDAQKGRKQTVIGRTPSEMENLYPDPKKTASILVDADLLSNGFNSPSKYSPSARMSSSHLSEEQTESQISTMSNQGRHSVASNISELESKSPIYINSASATSAISRSHAEDQSRYRVNSSPKFNGSYVRGQQDEDSFRVDNSLSHDRSCISDSQERRYRVETSPAYNGSRVDAGSRAENSPGFKRSSLSAAQDDRRYKAEESFTSNRSQVNETHEGRSRSGSKPSYNRSYISETQDERSCRSYGSGKQEEREFMLGHSPTKSDISGLQDEGVSQRESNASYHRYYVDETENLDRRSGGSRQSESLFSGRGRDSIGGGGGFVKSIVSGLQNQEKYSAGSPAYSKAALEEIQSAMAKAEYSASLFADKSSSSRNEFTTNSYLGCEREVSAAAVGARNAMAEAASRGGTTAPPRTAVPEKSRGGGSAVHEEGEEAGKKSERSSRGFGFLSAMNENIIVLSACNCAIVLGVVCSVISTTRASLAV